MHVHVSDVAEHRVRRRTNLFSAETWIVPISFVYHGATSRRGTGRARSARSVGSERIGRRWLWASGASSPISAKLPGPHERLQLDAAGRQLIPSTAEAQRRQRAGRKLVAEPARRRSRPGPTARSWIAGLWPISITVPRSSGQAGGGARAAGRRTRRRARRSIWTSPGRPARGRVSRGPAAPTSTARARPRSGFRAGARRSASLPCARAARAGGRDRPAPGRPSSTSRGATATGAWPLDMAPILAHAHGARSAWQPGAFRARVERPRTVQPRVR